IEVAAINLRSRPLARGAGERPPGYAGRGGLVHKMFLVAVMEIRQAFEASCQRLAHGGLSFEPSAPRLVAPRHLEDAVLGKVLHDAVKVVRIECRAQSRQRRTNIHGSLSASVLRLRREKERI